MDMLLFCFVVSMGINIFLFIPAFIFKTDIFTDLSYSLSFIILILSVFFRNNIRLYSSIISGMIIIWACRLGVFLFVRIRHMKKDSRFNDKRGHFWKFLSFWILQGFSVFIILLPACLYINGSSEKIFWPGPAVWVLGLIIESYADRQKYQFKNNPSNQNKFIQSGLWRFSRHPNYFGEILCWVGLYLSVFTGLPPITSIIGIISPLYITVLLYFISGAPLLEQSADKKWGTQEDYLAYKKNTGMIVPRFHRR